MFFRNLLVVTSVWFVALLWFSSDGGMSVPDVIFLGYVWLPLLAAWGVGFALARLRKEKVRRPEALLSLAVLLMGAVLYWTEGAIYLRLLASRDALEKYVAVAQRAHVNSMRPTPVGLFLVRETETLNNGTVRLITAECMFDDCGLVFSSGPPPVIGEDSYDHLVGNWWHWWRSW